ncbi:outer membrane beta-barrel protein [Pseudoflavitalea sp. X16]|uniref:TonB-dependent receptor n=1 Tax=Paraflavitalea devenefica TaxID=2716334 RepID=UPI001420BD40|nr:TonB-dependent receptor [Paraflavitalea devenefica]NII28946.1 outer membrane beta-barrel protein [Paraflavitalea devenefica]
MQKLTLIFGILLVSVMSAFAQQATLKGTVIDTSEKKNLTNSAVVLLRKSDSVMVTFSRTDKSGQFTLPRVTPGKFVLLITHPAYADYMDEVEVKDASPVNLGNVAMILKSQLLQEVVVSHKLGAIRIKGDTTEYKADSFYMKAGSSVEDLLKKLPGITVDKNGKITAQGEAVQKVLVDGEEFFSDDPTIATRGLLSDAVDKVQVFDKKSDQATFTGIDDGQKIKTIDLKLKEDKKKGLFGKLELGSNGDKYWNNSGMLNAFKGKRKFSAFGIMSSTGKTGLDWQENMNYGGAGGNMDMGMSEDGGMYITSGGGGDDGFGGGSYWGEGFPKGWAGGLHYSNKWNGDKLHLNGNYKFNKLNTEASGNTRSQYILKDSLYYVNEEGNNYNSKERHRIDGIYDITLDSSSSLKITVGGWKGKSNTLNASKSEWLDENGDPVRKIKQSTSSLGDNQALTSNIAYRKKFKKAGRTISATFNQDYRETMSEGFLYAENTFFSNGDSTLQIVDQKKINDNITANVNGRLSYTEPLSKRSVLEFNYGISNSHRQSRRTALESSTPNGPKYDEVVDSLTNDYAFNVLNNSAGINYRYAKPKKINFSFGANVSRADFTRKDLKTGADTRYSFTNFFPQANVGWTIGQGGNLRFNYFGSTQAPSIDQIQPVTDNSDQSNIRIGNPDLKQAFRNRFNLNYNSYKILSESGIWASINFSTVQNDFSSRTSIKDAKRVTQPVNVNGNYNLSGWFDYDRKIKKLKLYVGPALNFNVGRNVNFIDSLENTNNNRSLGGGIRLRYEIEKKFSITVRSGINLVKSKSSLRPDVVTEYWTQEHEVWANVSLPWKIDLNTECEFNFRQKTDVFDRNTNAIRWNANIEKKILKGDVGRIRFSAFDILDQNIGFNRSVNSNFINERTYDTFRRYFMLSLIWNFSKNGAKPMGW